MSPTRRGSSTVHDCITAKPRKDGLHEEAAVCEEDLDAITIDEDALSKTELPATALLYDEEEHIDNESVRANQ